MMPQDMHQTKPGYASKSHTAAASEGGEGTARCPTTHAPCLLATFLRGATRLDTLTFHATAAAAAAASGRQVDTAAIEQYTADAAACHVWS